MELKKYVLASNNKIYLTKNINHRLIEVHNKIGFWTLNKNNDACFVYIIETNDTYEGMKFR